MPCNERRGRPDHIRTLARRGDRRYGSARRRHGGLRARLRGSHAERLGRRPRDHRVPDDPGTRALPRPLDRDRARPHDRRSDAGAGHDEWEAIAHLPHRPRPTRVPCHRRDGGAGERALRDRGVVAVPQPRRDDHVPTAVPPRAPAAARGRAGHRGGCERRGSAVGTRARRRPCSSRARRSPASPR